MASSKQAPPACIDFAWKVIIAGQGAVGKSTLVHRYVYNEFRENTMMTIGCSHHSQYLERGGKNVNLVLWDLGGQDRFDAIHPAYAGGAAAGYVMFDMADSRTLEEIDKWVLLLRKCNPSGIPLFLVGTKFDLVPDQATLDAIYALASRRQAELGLAGFMVTSSKLDIGVRETIDYLVDYLFWKNGA